MSDRANPGDTAESVMVTAHGVYSCTDADTNAPAVGLCFESGDWRSPIYAIPVDCVELLITDLRRQARDAVSRVNRN